MSSDSTVWLDQTGGFTVSGANAPTILETLSVDKPTPNRFDSSTVTYLRQAGDLGDRSPRPKPRRSRRTPRESPRASR